MITVMIRQTIVKLARPKSIFRLVAEAALLLWELAMMSTFWYYVYQMEKNYNLSTVANAVIVGIVFLYSAMTNLSIKIDKKIASGS